ncbi:hypothetical protein NLG97_g8419 [Lecanicillium saksenae]|uniref:Uncharacterized protein n=1 Tax=Lecanicillium saksenae TaxID=468837 RepID=A0ACC1QKW9_9HYPO|nr:hypothetical protein NLG97_g8419 [Lecanicillium saksenae]
MSSKSYQKNGRLAPSPQPSVDDWEELEDASVITPIEDDEQILVQHQLPPKPPSQYLRPPKNPAVRVSRYSTVKIKRLKSRQRQKAQNAKAGISLITDMTSFGRQNKQTNQNGTKFVDSAALRALEGEPSSASVGNWNWLKRNKGQSPSTASPRDGRSPDQGLSPDDRPIMIGISVPPSDASSFEQTPYTAHPDQPRQPFDAAGANQGGLGIVRHEDPQPKSFWSPDTPDTIQSFAHMRPASSVYSAAPPSDPPALTDMPPVPSLPKQYKKHSRLISLELQGADDDDVDTPCTLFEEDGISPRNQVAADDL